MMKCEQHWFHTGIRKIFPVLLIGQLTSEITEYRAKKIRT